jgi:CRISPR/Cas system-associated protein endoribonuclease Cas2
MKTEIKILKVLIETKESPTIRELSRKIKADYKITHTAVKILANKGLIRQQVVGKAFAISFTRAFSREVFEAEYERRDVLLKDKNLLLASKTLRQNIKTSGFILLVFGSYAKNKQTKGSDIDLMFIIPDTKHEHGIETAISILPLPIHPIILTERQFASMKNSKESNVVQEAIRNNVIVYGIEQYYELINT